jgi:hypothetical protein
MKKAISAAYGAFVGLLVSVSYEQVLTKTMQWPQSAALCGAVVLGVLLLVVYQLISDSEAVVRRFSPISKVEGAWRIELTNNPQRPQSVCKINMSQRQYLYKGYAISKEGTLAAEWSSRHVYYDGERDEMSFTSDATLLEKGKRLHNYGYIRFFKNAEGNYVYGNGYFVDIADELTQGHMTLTRISDNEFDDIVKEMFTKTIPGKNGDVTIG